MYGRFVNNELYFAPSVLYYDDCTVCNPSDAALRELGYKEVLFVPMPDVPAGYYARFEWIENDEVITQVWDLIELPPDADLSPADALSIIIGGA